LKLRTFAQQAGVRYETAWRWFKAGKIKGQQLESGTIVIMEELNPVEAGEQIVVVYARVSANENRPNLNSQAERLCLYCAAKGWKVHKIVKEVGSGVNDGRKKLLALLADPTITVIVVEHKDRLTRFGFKYIETLLAIQGRRIEVVNVTENPIEDIIADFVSILYSFCAKLYGQRRAKRKTEKLVQELTEEAQVEKNTAKEGGKADATR
jgi:predicted site-specific integrase-resolvase